MDLSEEPTEGEVGGPIVGDGIPGRPLENPQPSRRGWEDPILEPLPGEPGVARDGTAVPLENPGPHA
jgi:hypothetical protein